MADVRRSKNNTFFAKQNHLALKKSELTKANILDAGVTRLTGLGKAISVGGGGGGALSTIANWDFDDLTRIFSDTGGTTASTPDGQNVHSAIDQSDTFLLVSPGAGKPDRNDTWSGIFNDRTRMENSDAALVTDEANSGSYKVTLTFWPRVINSEPLIGLFGGTSDYVYFYVKSDGAVECNYNGTVIATSATGQITANVTPSEPFPVLAFTLDADGVTIELDGTEISSAAYPAGRLTNLSEFIYNAGKTASTPTYVEGGDHYARSILVESG